jgi:hypothetical protein
MTRQGIKNINRRGLKQISLFLGAAMGGLFFLNLLHSDGNQQPIGKGAQDARHLI